MNKIEIKNLYLIFGSEKQKALRMLKEGKSMGHRTKRILRVGRKRHQTY